MTKFNNRFALKLKAVLTLAALALPLAAQQDVSPDHFDQNASAARSHKGVLSAHKTTAAKSKKTSGKQDSSVAKAKNKAPASSVLTADARTRPGSR